MKKNKLHIGCGGNTPDTWVNLDGSWNARLARHSWIRRILGALKLVPASQLEVPWSSDIVTHNVIKPLPFKDNSFSAVYASHLLEHLYLEDAQKFLKECFRVTRHGGIVRMMVPDLEMYVREYVSKKNGNKKRDVTADEFMRSLSVREESLNKKLPYKVYTALTDFHSHKWMYDEASLKHYFKKAGFSDVRRMSKGKSNIENIKEVEKREGLCVEGIKT